MKGLVSRGIRPGAQWRSTITLKTIALLLHIVHVLLKSFQPKYLGLLMEHRYSVVNFATLKVSTDLK